MADLNALNLPWRSIGRDIGKKLRDIFDPPAVSGPTKEERKAQRLADVLKGFTYLDNFDEIARWRREDVIPSQRATVPLFYRSRSVVPQDGQPQSRLLLCHDHSGW